MVNRREASFLKALADSSLASLLWPEGTLATVIGVGGALALHHWVSLDNRLSLVGDSLVLVASLLGIVFAGFALLIALLSDEYALVLDQAKGGIISFLRPFILAVGMQVITLLLALSYVTVARRVPRTAEFVLFVVWAFLFVYVLTDVVLSHAAS